MVRRPGAVVLIAFVAAALTTTDRPAAGQRAMPRTMVGNDACRPCHQAIYDSYSRTVMARTSGPAFPPLEGSFRHPSSGVSYRVYRDGEKALLSYERAVAAPLLGSLELKYYVGSNTRGRTFLFDIDGFLYQSPINYYAARRVWDMSPGYASLRAMELNTHPQLSEIGVNLGRVLCGIGDADGVRAAIARVLTHNPDLAIARQALADIAQRGCVRK
jgi:hypothetical protein